MSKDDKKMGITKLKYLVQPEEYRAGKWKRAKRKEVIKVDHKHLYQLIPIEQSSYFTHKEICSICGRVNHWKRIVEYEEDKI